MLDTEDVATALRVIQHLLGVAEDVELSPADEEVLREAHRLLVPFR